MGWITLTVSKANTDSALCDAEEVCKLLRWEEGLEQHVHMLEQEMHGHEEPSTSNYEVMREGDDEHCETAGPHLSTRPTVQQKVKDEQPMLGGGHPQGTPECD